MDPFRLCFRRNACDGDKSFRKAFFLCGSVGGTDRDSAAELLHGSDPEAIGVAFGETVDPETVHIHSDLAGRVVLKGLYGRSVIDSKAEDLLSIFRTGHNPVSGTIGGPGRIPFPVLFNELRVLPFADLTVYKVFWYF